MSEVRPRGNLCKNLISTRYIVAILGSAGMGIVYGLKVNLHVAIVSMVNHSALAAQGDLGHNRVGSDPECAPPEASSEDDTKEDGPFEWSTNIQGIILSAYFWGYMVAQIPGARVAELLSAKWVMFFSVVINVVCGLLSPICATIHFGALIAMRVGQGIGGGVTFPAMHVILAQWAPPNERSVMSSIVYAGTALGTVIFMLVSGMIAGHLGWEAVFYIEGGASAIWCFLWVLCVADAPSVAMFISQEERDYIVAAITHGEGATPLHKKIKFPWKSVFSSMPFLAILVAHTCSNWGWYMVLIELPIYMKTVLYYKINENAVLTSLPFFCMWIFSIILSKILDTLRTKSIISTTVARKIATGLASVVPMLCFITLCFIGCHREIAVALMTVAVMCIGAMFCGFLSNHIDIAPNFAGTLIAITNTVATIPGILVPMFVGKLTEQDPGSRSWRIIFYVTIGLYIIEILFYSIFGSGEEQLWNKPEE